MEGQGKNRRSLQPFRAGQVIWLPRGASWLNRDKARPYVLAAAPGVVRTGTLAYGSTAEVEQVLGAACSVVAPRRNGVNRNGLTAPTHFDPGILLRRDANALPERAGTLGKSMDAFWWALRSALGIGQGSCLDTDAPAGSRRGRIVELERTLARDMRTRFAVLLTEAAYSRRDNYHLILPLMPGDGQSAAEGLLRISRGDWISLFPSPTPIRAAPDSRDSVRLVSQRDPTRDGVRAGRGLARGDRPAAVRVLLAPVRYAGGMIRNGEDVCTGT